MAELVQTRLEAGVQTITLDQPERLNALSAEMFRALGAVVRAAERDPAVRVLVVTGAGRGFSSGADLTEFDLSGPGPNLAELLLGEVEPLIVGLHRLEKPVLAAINGVAAGIGLSLALACDLRYAAASARLVLAFVNIGLVPDGGSTFFLPRLVGTGKAMELALLGEPIDAAAAHEIGLVNQVLPDAELSSYVEQVAARLARGPAIAQALIKRGLRQGHELSLERVLQLEAGHQTLAARTPDFAEGVRAFREKRAPRFGSAPSA
ncbi:MAG: enoyl-CoA hydratase [Chloroflexi bacterium]|nr:enoyl-CoA hydratase [Chloroflexota bacterium]